jgi:lipopolysaccharide assembly outer membrane protein LptD (OstA)
MAAPDARAQDDSSPLDISADNVTGSRGLEGDAILLNGNVRIVRGRTVITADLGRYLRAQGMLFLDRNVKMVDSSITVTCDHVSYSELDDRLDLSGNVVITEREAVLRAPAGTYDRRSGRAHLFGGVTGREGERELQSDQAYYLRDSLLLQARGRVRGNDSAHRVTLQGDAVDFDRGSKLAIATGDPVLRSRDDDGVVTELRATVLRLDTERKIAEAIDSVRFVRDSLRASAKYARFDDALQRGLLLGDPTVWDDQTRMTGDTLEIVTENRILQ